MTEHALVPQWSEGDDRHFRAVLTPHRSLGPRGFLIFMSAISAISFGTGLMFFLMGAWPIVGFMGLDVLLIYIAFKANFRALRVYETVSPFWNINRLRHIITPQVTYFDLFTLNVDSDELVPFDGVDNVDLLRVFELKLRQRLQTHRGVGENKRVVDWITLDILTAVYPDAGRDNDGETLDNVEADLEWRVTDVVSVVADAEFDTKAGELGTASIGLGIDQTPRYSFFVGHRFINASDSSAATVNFMYQLNEKWRIDVYTQYDWGQDELLQSQLRFHRDLHDFVLSFGVLEDGTRDDTRLFIEVIPKGLPELGVRLR